jgi:hypothetical protein
LRTIFDPESVAVLSVSSHSIRHLQKKGLEAETVAECVYLLRAVNCCFASRFLAPVTPTFDANRQGLKNFMLAHHSGKYLTRQLKIASTLALFPSRTDIQR